MVTALDPLPRRIIEFPTTPRPPLEKPPLRLVTPPESHPPVLGRGFGRLFGGVGFTISMLWTTKTAFDTVKAVPFQLPWMPGPSVAPKIWTDPKRVQEEANARFGHLDTPHLNQLHFIREKQAVPMRRDLMWDPFDRHLMVQDDDGHWIQIPLEGQETGALRVGDLWKNKSPRRPLHERADDEKRLIEVELGRRNFQTETPKTDADKSWMEQYAEYQQKLLEALRKRGNGEDVPLPTFIFDTQGERNPELERRPQTMCSAANADSSIASEAAQTADNTDKEGGADMSPVVKPMTATNAAEGVNLGPNILEAFHNERVFRLMVQTLAEDLATFGVPNPQELATLTMEQLRSAGAAYPAAARELAISVYPNWHGQNVRTLYQDYNWRVERTGSAENAAPFIGNTLLDIGGGPGTFALEILRLKQQSSQPFHATIADIDDYRNQTAKDSTVVDFERTVTGAKLPFTDHQFDSGSLLYVLHHVTSDHDAFLRECARCVQKNLVIYEDVKVDTTLGTPSGKYRDPRPLESQFLELPLGEQTQFIAGVDYVCNHIASQALSMPVPGKYYEFSELERKLKSLFPDARVTKHFHGIYDTKCYPNPEAMYVVEFK